MSGYLIHNVSIHVPAWGTTYSHGGFKHPGRFQSTCPRGARLPPAILTRCSVQFQSTCPRGARHLLLNHRGKICVFQSTCPRGARHNGKDRKKIRQDSFNPRARVGHDTRKRCNPRSHECFNPRARVGHDSVRLD